jgi:D-aminopeptidase
LHAGPVITRQSLNWEEMDPFYEAATQAVDEAVINAVVQGEDVACVKPQGEICPGIDTKALLQVMTRYGRGPAA